MHSASQRGSFVVISVVLCGSLCGSVMAEPVRLEQVRAVADAFLSKRGLPSGKRAKGLAITAEARAAIAGIREIQDDGTVLAYIGELGARGFIVTSADTDITPIIAYSFRSSLPADDDKNPLYRMLKEDMKLRARVLAEFPEFRTTENRRLWNAHARQELAGSGDEAFRQWPPENTTATGGWLETLWDQHPPYNALCPLDPVDGNRTYVGCVATAFAQMVHYHQECDISFSHTDSYTSYAGIDVDGDSERYDFPSFTELNGYLAAIRAKYRAGMDLDDGDVAALGLACGVAVEMDYSSQGSGAHSGYVRNVLQDRFGFHSADLTGGLSSELYPVLRENLINGLPAYLTIIEPNAQSGHAIICDGYNTDGEYHLNFGWGPERPEAMTEVWYRLPVDVPSRLNVLTEAIVNIRPEEPRIDVEPSALLFYSLPGQDSEARTLRIKSNGTDTVINAISAPEGFLVARVDGPYSDRIDAFEMGPPDEETTINVKFCPENAGSGHGVLEILYDDGATKYVILNGCAFAGGTEVPGGEVSGRWSKDSSPYFVTGDITVPEGDVLHIGPGVQVMFAGPYGMTIRNGARLLAMGNEIDPIEFTAWNRQMGWTGLRFWESGDDDILRHCLLTFSKKGSGIIPRDYDEDEDEPTMPEPQDPNRCGGAVYCYLSSPILMNCKIANNAGDLGGAVYCFESSPVISNTVVANNLSAGWNQQCGGIFAEEGSVPEIENCTIVNNSPGGILFLSADLAKVTNTIVWGNNTYEIERSRSTPTISYCDVQGGYPGAGNIDADPCFFAPSSGTGTDHDGSAAIWTLKSRSACINAGTFIDLPTTDLAGNLRIYSEVVDIGAYESQSDLPLITVSPSVTLDAGFVHTGASSVTSVEIRNTGKVEVEIESVTLSDANSVFSMATPVGPQVLWPGDSVRAEIEFAPAQEMTHTAILNVHSTSSNDPHKSVSLRGVGVSGTVVPGGEVSGTWTKAESPFAVTGDIFIPVGRSLTIEPGVAVRFAGHFSMTVGYRATLDATGTEEEGIVFTARDKGEGWYGIRFVNTGNEDVLRYCTFEYAKKPSTEGGGFANLMGGAILCTSSEEDPPGFYVPSSPAIDHCLITNNSAEFGGGIMLENSDAVITNCRIVDNSADFRAGGVFIFGGFPIVANNVIAHNSGYTSGGLSNWYALSAIVNNTIVHNRPNGLYLESTDMWFWESAPILNNIVWGNEIFMEESVWSSEYDIRFNDIQGGWKGRGNIDIDPCFADPENRDYHLKSQAGRWDPESESWVVDAETSPCIDAGDPDSPIDDEPAPHGDRLNMGAYGGLWQASKSP